MSKWTDIRDGALDAMKQGTLNVAEETKQQFMTNFNEAGVPVIEEYAAQFTAAVYTSMTGTPASTKFAMNCCFVSSATSSAPCFIASSAPSLISVHLLIKIILSKMDYRESIKMCTTAP